MSNTKRARGGRYRHPLAHILASDNEPGLNRPLMFSLNDECGSMVQPITISITGSPEDSMEWWQAAGYATDPVVEWFLRPEEAP